MKFVNLRAPGEATNLFLDETADPEVQSGEVLIRVRAAGVNRPDVYQRQGLYPPPPGASPIMGLEVAGTIDRVGGQVAGWRVGDEVCALTNGGGYAELVAVPAGQVLPIPKGLSFVEAASLPETLFTVWGVVFDKAALKSQENFLVHGGASGIGSAAIQLAKAFGARVFATVGSDEKVAFCKRLGADVVVNYRTQDFVEVLKKETGPKGVQVILDMVGGDYFAKNLAVLGRGGRLAQIAFLRGEEVTADLSQVLTKNITYFGSTLRPQSILQKAQLAAGLQTHVWPLLATQQIRPCVFATFSLGEIVKAHTLMESNEHMGKIVLTVGE